MYDQGGNRLWVDQIGGRVNDYAMSVAIDPTYGAVAIGGYTANKTLDGVWLAHNGRFSGGCTRPVNVMGQIQI